MTIHRTVLVIAGSNEPEHDYKQQLQHDRSCVYRVVTERDNAAIVALAQAQQLDGILLELHSYPSSGHLLKQLRQGLGDRCPAIVVVGKNDAESAVKALKNGAADYLVKDQMTAADLCSALREAIAKSELQHNQRSTQEQFQISIENMLDCFGIFSAIRNAAGQIIDFRIDYLNAMACENNRMPKEMQIGRGLCEVLPAHRESGLFDQYCRLVETGEPFIQDSLVYEDMYGRQRLVRAFDIRATKLNDGFVASWRDITDRKQLELELNQTVVDLQTLLEIIPVGLAIATDATCTEMQHNAYLRQLLGVSPGSNISKSAPADQQPPYRVLQNGAEISADQLPMQQAARLGVEVRDAEFDILLPDGTVHQILSYATPLYNNQHQIRGVIGAFLDITERNQAAAALQASQQQLQRQLAEIEAIYQSAPIGLNILDTDLRFVRINQRLADINGLPIAAHLGHTVRELFPNLADAVEQLLRPVLETGEPRLNVEIHGETPAQPGVKRVWLEHFLPLKEGDRVVGISTVCEEITERIQIEAALRQSEEQFRNMADHAPVMVWVTDQTGYCTYLSKSWYEFTGQTEATGLGSGWLDAVHPDDRDFSRAVFLKANARCEAFRLEYRLRHWDGTYRWAIDAANPWFGEAGEFKGYIGSVIDISDRKQAEEALRLSEERYRALFESMNEGFCVVEMLFDADNQPLDYRFLEVNPVFEQQTGLRQAAGKTARQLLPNLEAHWFETYGKVALTGEPIRFENGSDVMGRWFEVAAFRIGSADSRKVAILFKDISDRKRVEAALRQSEERYRYLAEAIPQLVWTCDANGLCNYVNQRLCDYMGLTVEQIIDHGWFSAVHPNDQPTLQTRWLHALHHGNFYRDEYRVKRASDHSYRWHLVLGLPLKDPQGQVVKWFGTCTDIHDQKELDIERDRLLQLERDSREAAERANRIKDEFLAVLSHELRSPLNPILGWSKLLQTGKLDSGKTAEALATIERNAKIQMQLIDDLLDVAKILRGKLTLTMTSVNLASVVEAAIETVATAAAAKSITLDAELPDIGQVSGDAARLQQIVWNLLSNAIKFTPSHGQVTIRLERKEADRENSLLSCSDAHIIVADTGKGIAPDFIPYIFESFRQEDASITRRYGGLGLGLAIVRQLVEAHGGTIMAESSGEGMGATFRVCLPLLNLEPGTQYRSELPQQALNLAGVRVLTVDDDRDAREFLSVLLTQYGAKVLVTASAEEALAKLTLFQPDILVSDIGMPDVDGYSLIRKIRTLPLEQGGMIPAIALTAYAKEDDHQQAITSGYQQHITKPLDPEQLVQAIVAIVHRQSNSSGSQ